MIHDCNDAVTNNQESRIKNQESRISKLTKDRAGETSGRLRVMVQKELWRDELELHQHQPAVNLGTVHARVGDLQVQPVHERLRIEYEHRRRNGGFDGAAPLDVHAKLATGGAFED